MSSVARDKFMATLKHFQASRRSPEAAKTLFDSATRLLFSLGPLPARSSSKFDRNQLAVTCLDTAVWQAVLDSLEVSGDTASLFSVKTARKLLQELQYASGQASSAQDRAVGDMVLPLLSKITAALLVPSSALALFGVRTSFTDASVVADGTHSDEEGSADEESGDAAGYASGESGDEAPSAAGRVATGVTREHTRLRLAFDETAAFVADTIDRVLPCGASKSSLGQVRPSTRAFLTSMVHLVSILQKLQANPKKVFDVCLDTLLPRLLRVHSVFGSADTRLRDLSCRVIVDTLLGRDIVTQVHLGFSASTDLLQRVLSAKKGSDGKKSKKSKKSGKAGGKEPKKKKGKVAEKRPREDAEADDSPAEDSKAKKRRGETGSATEGDEGASTHLSYHGRLFQHLAAQISTCVGQSTMVKPSLGADLLQGLPALFKLFLARYEAERNITPGGPAEAGGRNKGDAGSSADDVGPKFRFLLELLAAALPDLVSGKDDGAVCCSQLLAVTELLKTARESNLYLPGEDPPPYPRLLCFKAVASVVSVVASSSSPEAQANDVFSARCQATAQLLALNHTVVCDDIHSTLVAIARGQCAAGNAAIPAVSALVRDIVNTHALLRQFHVLLGTLFEVFGLDTSATDTMSCPDELIPSLAVTWLSVPVLEQINLASRGCPPRLMPTAWQKMSASLRTALLSPTSSPSDGSDDELRQTSTTLRCWAGVQFFAAFTRQVLINEVNASLWHGLVSKEFALLCGPALSAAVSDCLTMATPNRKLLTAAALELSVLLTDLAVACGRYLHVQQDLLRKGLDGNVAMAPSAEATGVPDMPVTPSEIIACAATAVSGIDGPAGSPSLAAASASAPASAGAGGPCAPSAGFVTMPSTTPADHADLALRGAARRYLVGRLRLAHAAALSCGSLHSKVRPTSQTSRRNDGGDRGNDGGIDSDSENSDHSGSDHDSDSDSGVYDESRALQAAGSSEAREVADALLALPAVASAECVDHVECVASVLSLVARHASSRKLDAFVDWLLRPDERDGTWLLPAAVRDQLLLESTFPELPQVSKAVMRASGNIVRAQVAMLGTAPVKAAAAIESLFSAIQTIPSDAMSSWITPTHVISCVAVELAVTRCFSNGADAPASAASEKGKEKKAKKSKKERSEKKGSKPNPATANAMAPGDALPSSSASYLSAVVAARRLLQYLASCRPSLVEAVLLRPLSSKHVASLPGADASAPVFSVLLQSTEELLRVGAPCTALLTALEEIVLPVCSSAVARALNAKSERAKSSSSISPSDRLRTLCSYSISGGDTRSSQARGAVATGILRALRQAFAADGLASKRKGAVVIETVKTHVQAVHRAVFGDLSKMTCSKARMAALLSCLSVVCPPLLSASAAAGGSALVADPAAVLSAVAGGVESGSFLDGIPANDSSSSTEFRQLVEWLLAALQGTTDLVSSQQVLSDVHTSSLVQLLCQLLNAACSADAGISQSDSESTGAELRRSLVTTETGRRLLLQVLRAASPEFVKTLVAWVSDELSATWTRPLAAAHTWCRALVTTLVIQSLLSVASEAGTASAVVDAVSEAAYSLVASALTLAIRGNATHPLAPTPKSSRPSAAPSDRPAVTQAPAAVLCDCLSAATAGCAVLVTLRPHTFRMSHRQGAFVLQAAASALHCGNSAGAESPSSLSTATYRAACMLLYSFQRHRAPVVSDAVPVFMRILGTMIRATVQDVAIRESSAAALTLVGFAHHSSDRDDPYAHVLFLARVMQEMTRTSSVFKKHAAYLVSQYVFACAEEHPSPSLRDRLKPAIYALLDVMPPQELQLLHTTMSGSVVARTLLKSLSRDYETEHQFTGKV